MALQPIPIDADAISAWVAGLWWPVLRVGGFVATAPIASEIVIPGRIKIALAIGLTFLVAPLAPVPAGLSILSAAGALCAVQELLIGIAIGMVVQLAFEALTLAGQSVAMTMGLGFASLVDPQRGANTPVIGQMFTVFAMLSYLAINGHLMLIGALADSFTSLPIGSGRIGRDFVEAVAVWGGRVFEAGLLIALPAVVALIIVNLALGVVTRAAPQLNLFGVGFPITLLAGFMILFAGLDGIMAGINSLVHGSLDAVAGLLAMPAARVP